MEKHKDFFDAPLFLFIIMIMICSIVALISAQKYVQMDEIYFKRQIIWFVLSFIIMGIIFYFDFESIMNITPYIYIFGILLLIFVLVGPNSITPTIKGANSWIIVPGLGSMQPSEFMKIFLILMLSYIITKHKNKNLIGVVKSDFKLLFKICLIAFFPMGLTLLQNDFGTTLVMFVITSVIIFISGINWRIITSFLSLGIITILSLVFIYIYKPNLLLSFLDEYQLDRINAWLDPFSNTQGIAYQLARSILSIGSGMTYGKGFGQSNVYIPEAHTDFVFSIFAEEFGFIGASALISFYFLVIFRIVVIALYSKFFESLICSGVIALLLFHIFENIGMVIGLVPITGIPLPLMSYGGSSVMATMIGLSLILNISLKKKLYMFSDK
jgi:rod shape determining protein RodA